MPETVGGRTAVVRCRSGAAGSEPHGGVRALGRRTEERPQPGERGQACGQSRRVHPPRVHGITGHPVAAPAPDPLAGEHDLSPFGPGIGGDAVIALRVHLQAIRGQDTGTRKTIWFTGHSLGAALATLAVDRFGTERVGGLYTFGSPRVGDKVFQKAFTAPCQRFVNNTDIVVHLPPPTLLADYAHVGNLRFIDSAGKIVTDPTMYNMIESNLRGHFQSIKSGLDAFAPSRLKEAGQAIVDAVSRRELSALGDKLESLNLDVFPVAALADHAPLYYAIRIWNALQPDV